MRELAERPAGERRSKPGVAALVLADLREDRRLDRGAGCVIDLDLGDRDAPREREHALVQGPDVQALGQRELARTSYERAMRLDPSAAYALNNLCYGWILDGHPQKAIAACENALRIDPAHTAALNNLGLAHGVSGDIGAAVKAFADAGEHAEAQYNIGIVFLARTLGVETGKKKRKSAA